MRLVETLCLMRHITYATQPDITILFIYLFFIYFLLPMEPNSVDSALQECCDLYVLERKLKTTMNAFQEVRK